MGYRPPADIDPVARALIGHKARKLARSSGFTRSDADDIEQELALQAHQASGRFDPRRGNATTFYDAVLANKVRSIVDRARAAKRDRRRERPLDEAAPEPARSSRIDLKLDVDDALAALPPADRAMSAHFVSDSLAGAARAARVTRQQARSARARIARHLAPLVRAD